MVVVNLETGAATTMEKKLARACDACTNKLATWYCSADDAFLCQSCDASVHSANQLASRHERVRLKSYSSYSSSTTASVHSLSSSTVHKKSVWYEGFKKKPRTPRNNKSLIIHKLLHSKTYVEDVNSTNDSGFWNDHVNDDFLVPVLDPFSDMVIDVNKCESSSFGLVPDGNDFTNDDLEDDFNELTMDVESLLVDQEQGCLEFKEEDDLGFGVNGVSSRESYGEDEDEDKKRSLFLRLDYNSVITSWDNCSHGSPWITGIKPEFSAGDCSPEFLLELAVGSVTRQRRGDGGGSDGEREARVLRYREKRRRRLFAKKIRYEVRKLNAEKRPRIKGRFVKRTSFMT